VLAGLVVGCAQHRDIYWPSCYRAEQPAALDASTSAPGVLAVDVSAVGAVDDPGLDIVCQPEQIGYQPLSSDQVQCLAAEQSSLASAMLNERSAIAAQWSKNASSAIAVLEDLLYLQSVHERNRSAAAALVMYYRLVEAEAGHGSLKRSLKALDEVAQSLEEVRRLGLPLDVDASGYERQRLQLLNRQVEVDLAVEQLNGQLQSALGFERREDVRIWPQADLAVATETIDLETAVEVGLASRADLALMRQLNDRLNSVTLPAVKQALGTSAPLMGGALLDVELRRLFGLRCGQECEVELRQIQVSRLLADQERRVAEEIRRAAYAVESRLRQVSIAKAEVASWQRRIENLREQWEAGEAELWTLRQAELRAIEADQKLMHSVIEWKIARAELHEAQGLLARECGWMGEEAEV